jgi:hypothetical protein
MRRDFQGEGKPGNTAAENEEVELFHADAKILAQRHKGAKIKQHNETMCLA